MSRLVVEEDVRAHDLKDFGLIDPAEEGVVDVDPHFRSDRTARSLGGSASRGDESNSQSRDLGGVLVMGSRRRQHVPGWKVRSDRTVDAGPVAR